MPLSRKDPSPRLFPDTSFPSSSSSTSSSSRAHGLPFLAANITKYGDQFVDYLKVTSYKALLVTETHLAQPRMPAAILALGHLGWRAVFAPVVPTGRSEAGTAGGALVLTKSNIAVEDVPQSQATGDDWALVSVLLKACRSTATPYSWPPG